MTRTELQSWLATAYSLATGGKEIPHYLDDENILVLMNCLRGDASLLTPRMAELIDAADAN